MNEKEALRLALGSLEKRRGYSYSIAAIKQALTQPEPEPVAWIINGDLEELRRYGRRALVLHVKPITYGIETPLYTSTPKREWQGLTDVDVSKILDEQNGFYTFEKCFNFAKAIESKLKEKNT